MAQETGTVPQALRTRPRLLAQNRHRLEAFYELSARRGVGEFPQPISVESMQGYMDLLQIRFLDERELLFRYLSAMDNTYLQLMYEKREGEKPKST